MDRRVQRRTERYHTLEIEGRPECRELLLELLWELDSLGCEEIEDPSRTRLLAYFAPASSASGLKEQIEAWIGRSDRGVAFRLRTMAFDSRAWLDEYSRSFTAFEVSPTFFIHPSWSPPSPRHPVNILLEPGHGFGTGTHESTQLAMLAVEAAASRAASMLDVGTGSGILALAGTRLRPGLRVAALDIDPLAVEAAAVNFHRNQLPPPLLFAGTTRSLARPFDLVAANLTGALLQSLADELIRLCRRFLVVSGFTSDQRDPVRNLFEDRSPLRVRREWTKNDWSCFLLEP